MLDKIRIQSEGFVVEPNLLELPEVLQLIRAVESSSIVQNGRGGVRNLLDLPVFRELAGLPKVKAVVRELLGDGAFAVRGILFDKNDNANWKVPWHQDVTVAVTSRFDTDGYGPWSIKAGVTHVQPPAHVLDKMISIRIHLDDCPAENGALRVLPGTHRAGRLSQNRIDEHVTDQRPVVCEALAGDALIMRPLLLHSSLTAALPKHRRVLHFDYSNAELAAGLQWRERRQ